VVTNVDPLLGPLQNNGGPTATHALPLNSIAIDAGSDTVASAVDQRGSARKSRAHVDLGAFELQNSAPTAAGQSVATNQNVAQTITLSGSDAENDNFTYSIVSNPAHGTLSAISGTQITYTPAAGYSGTDNFTFRATDAYGALSNTATVSITINGAPVAVAQSVVTNQDTPKTITFAASDPEGDTFTTASFHRRRTGLWAASMAIRSPTLQRPGIMAATVSPSARSTRRVPSVTRRPSPLTSTAHRWR
jgi:hypothetical protein